MIEYLYSSGLRPEIGLCVEYLSWNKEQRLYMAWLRDLYTRLFIDESWTGSKPFSDEQIKGENRREDLLL
jgi:hypothetical protein